MNNTSIPFLKDEELVSLYVATRSQSYFEDLYHRYQRKIYRQCLQLTKDTDLAQDFTQDIFMQVVLKIDRFHGRSLFSTWLFSLTRNYCISKLRMGKNNSQLPLDGISLMLEDKIDAADTTFYQLQEALCKLSTEESNLLVMKYYENLEVTQMSQRLTLSVGAVKMRLKRSRDKLRKQLLLQYQ